LLNSGGFVQEVISTVTAQLARAGGEVRRLFHGRGGCFPGFDWLAIDYLPPVAVIRVYAPQAPVALDRLIEALYADAGIDGVVLQYRGRGHHAHAQVVAGEVAETLEVREGGLRYRVRPLQNQNAGLFLDMRNGRDWVRAHARGARVLNLFAYTCAFSVAALAGGAEAVVNVDMSSAALAMGRDNHRLNQFPTDKVGYMALDLLRSWSRVRKPGPYDLVIIDPPSFQPGSFIAERDYRKVLRRLPELTREGSRVLACHNDPLQSEAFLHALMRTEAPGFRFCQRLANADDFPEVDPDAGLKVLLYEREA
jgi:23S rRNA (cytosine1962-C5)-methyltransferase